MCSKNRRGIKIIRSKATVINLGSSKKNRRSGRIEQHLLLFANKVKLLPR